MTKKWESVEPLVTAAEIFEFTVDSITIYNFEGRIIYANKAAAKMRGFADEKEIIGKHITELIIEEEMERGTKAVEECVEKGFAKNFEFTAIDKDGKTFPINVNLTLLKDVQGEPKAVIVVTRDMTGIKKLLGHLEATKKELDEKVRDLEKFKKFTRGRESRMRKLEKEMRSTYLSFKIKKYLRKF